MKSKELERKMGTSVFSPRKDGCTHLHSQRKFNSDNKKYLSRYRDHLRLRALDGLQHFWGAWLLSPGFWTLLDSTRAGGTCIVMGVHCASMETFTGWSWQGCWWGQADDGERKGNTVRIWAWGRPLEFSNSSSLQWGPSLLQLSHHEQNGKKDHPHVSAEMLFLTY